MIWCPGYLEINWWYLYDAVDTIYVMIVWLKSNNFFKACTTDQTLGYVRIPIQKYNVFITLFDTDELHKSIFIILNA